MSKYQYTKKGQVIRSPDNKFIWGIVYGDVLLKKVQGSKHQLKVPPAWAIQTDALMYARKLGATQVVIHDVETDNRYEAAMSTFWKKGGSFDRGFGPQTYLPLEQWTLTKKNGEPQLKQLSMFAAT